MNKNKKGFTLVELLVVIVLIGLLVVIAVPSGLTISKIELIESGAIVWGQNNNGKVKNPSLACTKNTTGITACVRKDIGDMLNEENALEEDYMEGTTKHLKNPITDKSLNECYVEIYIKNKRVYASYDKTTNPSVCYY